MLLNLQLLLNKHDPKKLARPLVLYTLMNNLEKEEDHILSGSLKF